MKTLLLPGSTEVTVLCEPCPAGSYKGTIGNTDCISCGENSTSEVGSSSPLACVCNAGYEVNQNTASWMLLYSSWIDKPDNHSMVVSNFLHELSCVVCPPGSHRPVKSLRISDETNMTEYFQNSSCQKCVAGKFSAMPRAPNSPVLI